MTAGNEQTGELVVLQQRIAHCLEELGGLQNGLNTRREELSLQVKKEIAQCDAERQFIDQILINPINALCGSLKWYNGVYLKASDEHQEQTTSATGPE